MREPPQRSPFERIAVSAAVKQYRESLLGDGAPLPAELSSMVAMLGQDPQFGLTARSLFDEAAAIAKATMGLSAPMWPARSVRGEATGRSMTVESFLEPILHGGSVEAGRVCAPGVSSVARRLAAFRRGRPSRETEAWRRLAAAWYDRYGASIDEDALVLELSPFVVLLARRTAAAQAEANSLGEDAGAFLCAVTEARRRIDTAVPLDAELVRFSQLAFDFDRGCEALDAGVRDWWHQARQLGCEAAIAEEALRSEHISRALVTCATAAHAWIVGHPPRRLGFQLDVVRLLAFHGWNEQRLVGGHALAVDVSDLALPSETTRRGSSRLRQASHRLQQLCRDVAARRAKEPETAPGV